MQANHRGAPCNLVWSREELESKTFERVISI